MMTIETVFPLILCAISVVLVLVLLRLRKDKKEAKHLQAELLQRMDSIKDENKQISDEILLCRMESALWEKIKKRINGRN